jgi:hypothetical protein
MDLVAARSGVGISSQSEISSSIESASGVVME